MRIRHLTVTLALLLTGGLAWAQDPREILKQTGDVYRNLESGHFEGMTTSFTSTSVSQTENQLGFEIALAEPNKVKVEFRYPSAGNWTRVSDGVTTWRYRSLSDDLRKGPAAPRDAAMIKGTVISRYQAIYEAVSDARLIGVETVPLQGTELPCYVVEVSYESRSLLPETEQLPTRYWIDRDRSLVLREVSGTASKSGAESRNTETIQFSFVSVDQPVDDSAFVLDTQTLAKR